MKNLWFFPYIGLNCSINISFDNFFSQSSFLFLKSVFVCLIYHFYASLKENIAVLLRLLFSFRINMYWSMFVSSHLVFDP